MNGIFSRVDIKLPKTFIEGGPFRWGRSQLRKLFSEFIKSTQLPSNDPFYGIDGELCVDSIIRNKSLYEDFNEILTKLGLPQAELPWLKGGIREDLELEVHYSQYYDDETKKIVAEQHKNDIRFIGYQFETE